MRESGRAGRVRVCRISQLRGEGEGRRTRKGEEANRPTRRHSELAKWRKVDFKTTDAGELQLQSPQSTLRSRVWLTLCLASTLFCCCLVGVHLYFSCFFLQTATARPSEIPKRRSSMGSSAALPSSASGSNTSANRSSAIPMLQKKK